MWLRHLKPQGLRGIRTGDTREANYVTELVLKEVEQLKEENWELGEKAYTAAISTVAKYGKAKEAQQLFDDMKTCGGCPGVSVYNALLQAYSNNNDSNGFFRVWREMQTALDGEMDSVTAVAVLSTLQRLGKGEEAFHAAATFVKNGIPHTHITYNILLACCSSYPEARKVLAEMREGGHHPDVVSLGAILKACSADVASAEEVWKEAESTWHLTPTVKEWTSLLSVYKKAGDATGASQVWERLKAARCRPNTISYGVHIQTLSEAYKADPDVKHIVRAKELFAEAVKEGAVTSPRLFSILMAFLARAGDREGGLWLHSLLADHPGIHPERAYNLAVSRLLRGNYRPSPD